MYFYFIFFRSFFFVIEYFEASGISAPAVLTLNAEDYTWGDYYVKLRVWNSTFILVEDATEEAVALKQECADLKVELEKKGEPPSPIIVGN